MPNTPYTPARLAETYRRIRRWTDVSMTHVTLLSVVLVFAFVTFMNGYYGFATSRGLDDESDFNPFSAAIGLSVVGGAVGLAFGLGCFGFYLFKTLACAIAVCFLVAVLEFLLLFNQFNPAPIAPWLPILLLVFGGSVVWCLRAACYVGAKSHWTVGLRITAVVCAGLILFPAWVWVFGPFAPQGPQTQETQNAAPRPHAPTWPEIRTIIAEELRVPQERVVPSAQLRWDLNADSGRLYYALESFDEHFGNDARGEDEVLLITVQDMIDYASSPDTFRTRHQRQRSREAWDKVRTTIAKELGIQEERVIPSARLREDLGAGPSDVLVIPYVLSVDFGIDYRTEDADLLFTVQDVIDFVYSPETFRAGQHRPAPPVPHVPTWPEMRTMIAEELGVSEERVVPSARLREDLSANVSRIRDIIDRLGDDFWLDVEDTSSLGGPEDENLLITVQDVIDYANSAETFRASHQRQ